MFEEAKPLKKYKYFEKQTKNILTKKTLFDVVRERNLL